MSTGLRICMVKGGRGYGGRGSRFEICRDANAVLQKINIFVFFIRLLGNKQNMDSDIGTPCSIRFQATRPKKSVSFLQNLLFFVTRPFFGP